MGAAEGDLAGAEIVEQGACALHLCKVEFFRLYFFPSLQEFLLMSPLDFVVILHDVRLVGGVLWWRARGGEREHES